MRLLILITALAFSATTFSQTPERAIELAKENYKNGDYEKALQILNSAVELFPNNTKIINERAIANAYNGKVRETFEDFRLSIKIDSTNADTYNSRGTFLLVNELPKESIRDFDKALEFAKREGLIDSIIFNRSSAKSMIRDFESAYDDLMILYKKDSTNIDVVGNLGTILDEVGRKDDALKFMKKAMELDPTRFESYSNIAFFLSQEEKYEESIMYCSKALELKPDQPYTLNNRGFAYLKSGKIKEALADIKKSISIDPYNSYAFKNLALVYVEENDLDAACEALERAKKLDFELRYGNEVNLLISKHCKKL